MAILFSDAEKLLECLQCEENLRVSGASLREAELFGSAGLVDTEQGD
jgi:hypothetical protein